MMDPMQPVYFWSETRTGANRPTARIRNENCSMRNGEGGRFQLLTGGAGTLDGAAAPAGAGEPLTAPAGGTPEGSA